jgi:hypothetical protein
MSKYTVVATVQGAQTVDVPYGKNTDALGMMQGVTSALNLFADCDYPFNPKVVKVTILVHEDEDEDE